MDLSIPIPDDIAIRLSQVTGDLSRRTLEVLAIKEYKSGHIIKPELRRMLGFETRYELDGFLKEHSIYEGCTLEEVEQQVEGLKQLGF